ncbi:hypothetical protein JOQ06_003579, partial [Pogonophryne albipinna]
MEPLPGYEAYGARPRRQTRLPTRYADYDVDHLGYISQRYRQEEETSRPEGKARMTPLTSPNDSSPPRHLNRRDANFQEMDFSYGAGSQQLFPEREPRDRFREYSTHLPTSLHYKPPREDDRVELENIRQERFLLQQTQQRMSSDIDELKALRADMRQLVDTVRNLQTPSLHGNKPELTVMQPPAPFVGEPNSEDEDDWPAHHYGLTHNMYSTQHMVPFLLRGQGRTTLIIQLPGTILLSHHRDHPVWLQMSPSTKFMVVTGVSIAVTQFPHRSLIHIGHGHSHCPPDLPSYQSQ